MREIQNPARHDHRPTSVGGQRICQDCGEVLINPILAFDDRRLQGTAAIGMTAEDIAVALLGTFEDKIEHLKSQMPKPLDWLLLEMCELLDIEWPDWIDQLSGAYDGDPPHTRTWRGL